MMTLWRNRSSSITSSSPRISYSKSQRNRHYRGRTEAHFSRRSPNSSDSDFYQHHRRPVSKPHRYRSPESVSRSRRKRRSLSPFCSRRKIINSYSSPFSSRRERFRPYSPPSYSRKKSSPPFDSMRKSSSPSYSRIKNSTPSSSRIKSSSPSFSRRKRFSYSPDLSSRRHRCLDLVPYRRKFVENSDAEILEEKQSKRRIVRSSLKGFFNVYRYYGKSARCMQEGDLQKALKYINLALELHIKEDKFLSKLYSRRGTIYSLFEKPRCSFQGCLDWEHAYILNKDNMEARKNISKVLFMGANKFYRMKAYSKVVLPLKYALDLYSGNGEASILMKLVQRKLESKSKKKKTKSRF